MSTKNECCPKCTNSGEGHYYNPTRILACPCHQISDYDALVEVSHSDGFAGASSHKPNESWEEAFDWLFYSNPTHELSSFPDVVFRLKTFIRATLHSQREELCGRLEGLELFMRPHELPPDSEKLVRQIFNILKHDAIKAIKNND